MNKLVSHGTSSTGAGQQAALGTTLATVGLGGLVRLVGLGLATTGRVRLVPAVIVLLGVVQSLESLLHSLSPEQGGIRNGSD